MYEHSEQQRVQEDNKNKTMSDPSGQSSTTTVGGDGGGGNSGGSGGSAGVFGGHSGAARAADDQPGQSGSRVRALTRAASGDRAPGAGGDVEFVRVWWKQHDAGAAEGGVNNRLAPSCRLYLGA